MNVPLTFILTVNKFKFLLFCNFMDQQSLFVKGYNLVWCFDLSENCNNSLLNSFLSFKSLNLSITFMLSTESF